MLRIKSLKLVNFGPYYGEHTLFFTEGDGVSIVWGNNGYGKTSIMNAFRYVLWGKIYDRKRRTLSAYTFVNTNAVTENGSMFVELHMIYDDDDYMITRGLKRVSGGGNEISDYKCVFHIKKNGIILSPSEKESILESILPDKISRFYLFDGELLSEYEDLLDDTDESGSKIKRSIEDILGLPVLEDARDNLAVILGKFNAEISKITAADERTAILSKNISETQEHLDHLNQSKIELQDEKKDLSDEEIDIQEMMKNNAKYSALLSQKDDLEKQVDDDKSRLNNLINSFQNIIDGSWRYIINDVVESIISDITPLITSLSEKIHSFDSAKAVINYIETALNENADLCPICDQKIVVGTKDQIINKLKNIHLSDTSHDERIQLQKLEAYKQFLEASIVENDAKLLFKYLNDIEECQAKIDIHLNQINNIHADLSTTGHTMSKEEINNLPQKYKIIIDKKEENKKAILENQQDIDITKAAIEKFNAQISKLTTNNQAHQVIAQREYTQRIYSLFEKSIALFRNDLKTSVQKDASDLFVEISHDKGYRSLVINDNYGLKIIDCNGNIVPNRSSGYEQVVAISLISALHKNAPIEGPIFMDSTFQRVDDIHKLNILKMLPEFGSQVIVLAYDGEIGEKNVVRELLGESLLAEYRLQHPSSSKTSIEPNIE